MLFIPGAVSGTRASRSLGYVPVAAIFTCATVAAASMAFMA